MLNTTRRAIPYPNPDRSDRPDVPTHIANVAEAVDQDVLMVQGTHAARIAAAHQNGGGLVWWETDTKTLWWDDGAGWTMQGTVDMGLLIAMS